MAEPGCHYCDRPAEAECPTCGRLYCPEHGEDVCLRCLAPEAAAPTQMAYRGAVVALVVGSLVALFVVLRPPESESASDSPRTLATTTPAILATATPTRAVTRTATTTPPPAQSPTLAPVQATHTVAPGDTLSGIAAQYNTTVEAIIAANPGTTENLQIGDVLRIPRQ